MDSAIEPPASTAPMTALHRRVTGLATVAAAAVYLGTIYTAFGVVMVAGGTLFGMAAWRAAVFPRWASGLLIAGSLLPLAVALGGLPALLNVAGNVLRNLGLVGLGLAALRGGESRRNG